MSDAQGGSTTSRYEVLAKLSQGSGTADLFAARAAGVERLVVIKRLRRDAAKEKAVAQAFLAEARVAAKLAHPNVAQVFEVGKLGGAYFFTTEYVDGETIRALVAHARGKKIQVPIRAFLTIAAGAAAGLHHAHERNGMDGKSLNIIHGDISPTNVMISREGIVKVLDFGSSRGRTPTKLAYASPEQLRGDKLDRRSDLFSLGVVLWELLTLGELFQRATDDETKTAVESDEAPAPSMRRFDVPPELDAILVKLVSKKLDDRYQTCGELLAAIDSLSTKLGFSLSTNDLARMMRLWFGPPPAATDSDELTPIVVSSEDILAEPPAGAHPVDEQLGTVREAAATVRSLAQRIGGTARAERPPTTPPSAGEVEDARENFAQIRDRILEQARKRKTTKAPPLAGQAASAVTPPSGVPAAMAAADSAGTPARKKPETLNAANNAYAFITKVAETATAPQKQATAVDAAMALKVLQSASAHAEGDGSNGSANGNLNATGGHRAVTATYDAVAAAAAAEEIAAAAERAEAALAASTEASKDAQGSIEAKSAETKEAAPVAKIELSKSAAAEATAVVEVNKTVAKEQPKAEPKAEAKSEAKAEKTSEKKAEKSSETKKAANDEKAPATKSSKTNGVAARASTADDAKTEAKRTARSPSEVPDEPAGRPSWIVPAILVAAAALILIFVMKGRGHNETKKPEQVAQNQGGAGAGAGAMNGGATNTANTNTANTGSAATGSAVAMAGSDTVATGSATGTGSATTMVATPDAAVVVAPVDAAVVAEAKPDAAVVATNTGTGTKTNTDTGTKTNTDTGTKTNTGTGTKTNTGTGTKTNTGTGTKTNTGTGTKTNEPAVEETIEDLFAKGDFAKTNKACAKNLIFTPDRLKDCALAACHATNMALAKRWLNAIAKAARPDIVAQCKTLGLDLEEAPPAPAPAPAP